MPNYRIEELLADVAVTLQRHGASHTNALIVARHLVQAEIDGQSGHGLSRVKSYTEQLASGKVNGTATPTLEPLSQAAYRINAHNGFAFPALELAINTLASAAKDSVIATASIYNSHHCGALSLHVEALAKQGLLGLMFANSPQPSIKQTILRTTPNLNNGYLATRRSSIARRKTLAEPKKT